MLSEYGLVLSVYSTTLPCFGGTTWIESKMKLTTGLDEGVGRRVGKKEVGGTTAVQSEKRQGIQRKSLWEKSLAVQTGMRKKKQATPPYLEDTSYLKLLHELAENREGNERGQRYIDNVTIKNE